MLLSLTADEQFLFDRTGTKEGACRRGGRVSQWLHQLQGRTKMSIARGADQGCDAVDVKSGIGTVRAPQHVLHF